MYSDPETFRTQENGEIPNDQNTAPQYVRLTDEQWLEEYENRAAEEPASPEDERLIYARRYLVAVRLVYQDPEVDRICLRLQRGLEYSPHNQAVLAKRLDRLAEFPKELRTQLLIEQFSIIRSFLPKTS